MNNLARVCHVSKSTISRAVREDLGVKSFTRKRRSLLTERARAIRRERAPKVLDLLKNLGSDVRVFVDEKKVIAEEVTDSPTAGTPGLSSTALMTWLLRRKGKIQPR